MSKSIKFSNDIYLDSKGIMHKSGTQMIPLNTYLNGIIESGSNSNGSYIKFADGTLIQYGNVTLTTSDNRSAGGLTYYSAATTINFPISFKDSSYSAFSNVLLANMNYFCNSYIASNDASTCILSFVATANNETRIVHWIAIGRWK